MGFHFVHHGTGDPLFSRLSRYFDAFVCVCYKVTTVSQRSVLMGIFGAIFAIASIGGPVLGGLFAGMPPFSPIVLRLHILKDKASWRWVNPPSYLTRLDMSRFVCLSRTVGVSVEFIF
jgi:MFS family permease